MSTALALLALDVVGAQAQPVTRLSTKAPELVSPAYDWSGFYVGANLGGQWANARNSAFTSFDNNFILPSAIAIFNGMLPSKLSPSGLVGGVHGGYNWQISSILFGVEADFDGLSGSKKRSVSGELAPTGYGNTFQFEDRASARWMSTVRARAGVLATDRLLIFATGGVAFSSWQLSHSFIGGPNLFVPAATFVAETTRAGWVVGGGVEYALNSNWFVGAEYLHADFGKATSVLNAPSTFPAYTTQFTYHAALSEDLARFRISYKIGSN
jgi:outer membrane immunogenic protein